MGISIGSQKKILKSSETVFEFYEKKRVILSFNCTDTKHLYFGNCCQVLKACNIVIELISWAQGWNPIKAFLILTGQARDIQPFNHLTFKKAG